MTEKLWQEKIVAVYGDNFKRACSGYGALDDNTKKAGALVKMMQEMQEGDFLDFFCKYGFDVYEFAVDSLAEIGAADSKALIDKTLDVILKYEDDERIKAYKDLYDVLPAEDRAEIKALSEEFCKDSEKIQKLMLEKYQ